MRRIMGCLGAALLLISSCGTLTKYGMSNGNNRGFFSESQLLQIEYPCYYYTSIQGSGMQIQSEYEHKGYVLSRQSASIEKSCNVYLPPNYDRNKTYKLIFILHGIGGDENNDWLTGTPDPVSILDDLINGGEIDPCIAVFPNGRSSINFRNRGFENQAGFYFFANELINDLLPYIQDNYSASRRREDHAICGLSMGGMQTINIGLCQSLEYFAWFGAFSAAPTSYSSDQIAYYLERQNGENDYPVKFFYNICGASDEIAGRSHEAAVDNLGGKSSYINDKNFIYTTIPGAHDFSVWHVGLKEFLKISFS